MPLRPLLLRLAAAPGQAGIALAGVVASFALMVAMAIMVGSFRDSVDRWLGRVLAAPRVPLRDWRRTAMLSRAASRTELA